MEAITYELGSQECKEVTPVVPLTLSTLVLQSGERLPYLKDLSTGQPLYEPLIFSLTELRGRNLASNTILQALRSVMLLLRVLNNLGVNLVERVNNGRLLEYGELEAVTRACSQRISDCTEVTPQTGSAVHPRSPAKRSNALLGNEVEATTKSIRIHYIKRYLNWLATSRLYKLETNTAQYNRLLAERDSTEKILSTRTPVVGRRNSEGHRQGLAPTEIKRLQEVISPDHPENPWSSHLRLRNYLIVRWYLCLGIRRSELLGVKVSDIEFRDCQVLIARRPDDAEDPRINEPYVKTADKLLPVDRELINETRNYVLHDRQILTGARVHPFLFVAYPSGTPLSISAVNLIFQNLKLKVKGIPDSISPHTLRHTWNDQFSLLADSLGLSDTEEARIRARLMGWSPTSEAAAHYTRRHVKKRAREASLDLQQKLMSAKGTSK